MRFQQKELQQLFEEGIVKDAVQFGFSSEQKLEYVLVSSSTVSKLEASIENQRISITIPSEIVSELMDSDRVGCEANQQISQEDSLFILVEKDFKCLTPRVEDGDTFPHPEESEGHAC